MRIRDIIGLIIVIAGLFILSFIFESGFDWFGHKYPSVMAVFVSLFITGWGLVVAYIAAGLAIHSYDNAIERYDRNHGKDMTYRGSPIPESVEQAHRRIAGRVAWKFAAIVVAIFWGCVILSTCSHSTR